ncbi:hypothetical protein VP06_20515 [Methylobacterium aquaticum]|jgi:ubiquinone biosynthesis protein|uniref:ABC1 atypical kinase-like domain-containing protein n=2 Tax=Methylobacterium aquaticum TaxID=270351 RepID=A0A0J6SC32_9HYPH|nr:hypothetical protein VP06_20515 [Methylobacterium aquaticum]
MRVKVFRRTSESSSHRNERRPRPPTPLVSGRVSQPLVLRPLRPMSRFRGLTVLWRFTAFFLILQGLRLTGRYTHAAAAARLLPLLQDLGGLWIKLGQLLSLRSDALPEEICRDLAQLQSRAEGFDPALSLQTIEEELGEPVEVTFSRFDTDPFAAASMGQCHFAILRETQTPVVVKVQRPDVAEGFRRDMQFLRSIVGVLNAFHIAPWMQFDDLLWELEEVLQEESDYRFEATNLKRLRRNLRKHDILAPRPFLDYCTPRMIVMEYIPAVTMSDYIALQREDRRRADRWLAENDIDPEEVAQRLISSLLRQVFEENLFHGDLHPGNIMLMRDGDVAFIDFGTAGSLERQFLDIYGLAVSAMVQKNFAKAADYILALCVSVPSANLPRVRAELVRAFRAWEMRSNLQNASYFERALSTANTETNRILAKHRIQPSWALLRLGRTLGTLDATLSVLIPDGDVRSLYAVYFRERAARTNQPAALARRAAIGAFEAMETVQEIRVLLLPHLRNRTLAVRGAVDRMSLAVSVVLRYLRIGLLVVSALLFYYIIDKIELLDSDPNETVRSLFGWLPGDSIHWGIMCLGLLLAARMLTKMVRVLRSE